MYLNWLLKWKSHLFIDYIYATPEKPDESNEKRVKTVFKNIVLNRIKENTNKPKLSVILEKLKGQSKKHIVSKIKVLFSSKLKTKFVNNRAELKFE